MIWLYTFSPRQARKAYLRSSLNLVQFQHPVATKWERRHQTWHNSLVTPHQYSLPFQMIATHRFATVSPETVNRGTDPHNESKAVINPETDWVSTHQRSSACRAARYVHAVARFNQRCRHVLLLRLGECSELSAAAVTLFHSISIINDQTQSLTLNASVTIVSINLKNWCWLRQSNKHLWRRNCQRSVSVIGQIALVIYIWR